MVLLQGCSSSIAMRSVTKSILVHTIRPQDFGLRLATVDTGGITVAGSKQSLLYPACLRFELF